MEKPKPRTMQERLKAKVAVAIEEKNNRVYRGGTIVVGGTLLPANSWNCFFGDKYEEHDLMGGIPDY